LNREGIAGPFGGAWSPSTIYSNGKRGTAILNNELYIGSCGTACDEIAVDEGKAEIKTLDARRKEAQAQLETADEPPPLLHPNMSKVYRTKVTQLAATLERPDTRAEATELLRGLIDEIVLNPEQGQLRVDLRGNLAAMLRAATDAERPSDTDGLHLQAKLVAGGGFEPPTFGL
jgi:site-specific DNA recombinase